MLNRCLINKTSIFEICFYSYLFLKTSLEYMLVATYQDQNALNLLIHFYNMSMNRFSFLYFLTNQGYFPPTSIFFKKMWKEMFLRFRLL